MTNNQLTKEWLQQTIAELESVRDEIPFGIDTNSELELAAFKLALAAMDSEPVAWMSKGGTVLNGMRQSAHDFAHYNIPLYRHAQPAPVVLKDHQIRELVNQLRDIAIEYHGTQQLRERISRVLRAAMLQAEPVTTANKLSNSPVIPDGLIAAVNHLLDSDGSRGCYSAIQCGDAHDEIERLLAAALQEEKTERKK